MGVYYDLQVVKNCLADIKSEREVVSADQVPEPSPTNPVQWKSVPKLSYGPNKKYPHLSKAVEVKMCPKEGRYMVAKQKIVPGDVLMVDTAYATSLFEDYYKSHCNHCFIRIKNEPVRCPTCDMHPMHGNKLPEGAPLGVPGPGVCGQHRYWQDGHLGLQDSGSNRLFLPQQPSRTI